MKQKKLYLVRVETRANSESRIISCSGANFYVIAYGDGEARKKVMKKVNPGVRVLSVMAYLQDGEVITD